MKTNFVLVLLLCCVLGVSAQKKKSKKRVSQTTNIISGDTISDVYNPLAPAKAAFYSAVLPGLGQYYNKSYWKIPIVYTGLIGGLLIVNNKDREYNKFRDAFKSRLAGFRTDEFWGDPNSSTPRVSTERLIDAQKKLQRDKNVWIAVTVGIYLLNIIEANVDAHLKQFNVSDKLTIQPNIDINPINHPSNYGLSLTYKFN